MLATNKKRPPNGDLLVGMTGFEPATTRPPGVYSTGLSYIPFTRRSTQCVGGFFILRTPSVGPTGFEPVTSTMSTWRSNQLSYGPYTPLLHSGVQR